MHNYYHHYNGFSLVEVLVAISLLLIALVGPMSFFARSSQSAEVANDRIIATFLAQEGVELLQKKRDDLILSGDAFGGSATNPWADFLSDTSVCFTAGGCRVQLLTNSVTVASCGSNSCELRYDGSQNRARYNHSSGDVTPYTRRVRLEPASGARRDQEVDVISTVEWRSTALQQPQTVEVRTTLFNVFSDLW